jgi:hypothetical protein
MSHSVHISPATDSSVISLKGLWVTVFTTVQQLIPVWFPSNGYESQCSQQSSNSFQFELPQMAISHSVHNSPTTHSSVISLKGLWVTVFTTVQQLNPVWSPSKGYESQCSHQSSNGFQCDFPQRAMSHSVHNSPTTHSSVISLKGLWVTVFTTVQQLIPVWYPSKGYESQCSHQSSNGFQCDFPQRAMSHSVHNSPATHSGKCERQNGFPWNPSALCRGRFQPELRTVMQMDVGAEIWMPLSH